MFVSGLEDGLFPLARAAEDPSQLEEERRLFYVGITRAETKLYLTCAEQRRRNGEMMFSMPSRFLKQVTISLAERQKTARAKTEGRGGFASLGGTPSSRNSDDSWGRSSYSAGGGGAKRSGGQYGSASYGAGSTAFGKSAGSFSTPARRDRPTGPEDESQDAPMFAVGEKVRHAKFGSGTIAELTGSGRDLKVRIDFEDEEIGRKTLVLAQAKLERGWE